MTVFTAGKKSQSWSGEPIGILILDAHYPCISGNVGHAETVPFPGRYEKVKGTSIKRLIQDRAPALIDPFIEGAKALEARGAKAISGACGFMALFQQHIQAPVDIPVRLSSLCQLPYVHAIQTATGLPVFDYVTMINYVGSSLRQRQYDD